MKTLFLFLFITCTFIVKAHQDKYVTIQKDNIYLQYVTGWSELEIGNQINILVHLTEKLVRQKKLTKEKIYIYFDHDYTLMWDSAYYALGYGSFSLRDYENGRTYDGKGIKLIIRDKNLNIQQALNLILTSFTHVEYIRKKQQRVIIDLHEIFNGKAQYDTLYSIPAEDVNMYMRSKNGLTEKLISQKTYRNLSGPETFWNIDYYYQNNKYHFYNTSEPEKKYNPKTGNDDTVKIFGEDILIVDNILEIFGDWNWGHFVFVNDSSFYFIDHLKTKIQGPFEVDSIRAGRQPVRRFEFEYFDFAQFTLYFDNYRDYTKALFLPEEGRLINNYHLIENRTIKNWIKDKKSEEKEKYKKDMFFLLAVPFFILSVLINIYLIYKKRNI